MSMLQGVARALGIALAWGLAWAPIALLIGVTVIDPDGSMDEMWPAVGAFPGFLCALLFCALLSVAARGRRIAQLALPHLAALGALAGLLVGVLPFVIGGEPAEGALDLGLPAVIASFIAMSSLSALVTGLVARSRITA